MLRGINRSIIEINETENKYFEKVLIFVKPEFCYLPSTKLKSEATKMVGLLGGNPIGLKSYLTARKLAKKRRFKKAVVFGLPLFMTILTVIILILK